jgi:hypothetical protein
MAEAELSAKDWKELGQGFKNLKEFAREFPDGIKGAITSAKDSVKNQVMVSVEGLLTPITNVIDQAAADITKELGINDSITSLTNSILNVINSFTGFLARLILLFTDLSSTNTNLQNLLAWLDLLNPIPTSSGIWGIINPWSNRMPIIIEK